MSSQKSRQLIEGGFSLTEVIIGTSLLGLLALAGGYLLLSSNKAADSSTEQVWIESYRQELIATLQDDTAFNLMVGDATRNPGFACLRSKSDCGAFLSTPARVVILDRNGQVINDATNPTAGFDRNGIPCTNFDAVNGNPSCPYRIATSWRAQCTTNCVNPEVRLRVDFLHSPGPGVTQKNLLRYNFKLYRNSQADSLIDTCTNQGGTLQASGQCLIDNSFNCPPGEAIIGFDTNNDKICQPLAVNYSCPVDEFLQGVDGLGNPICSKCP